MNVQFIMPTPKDWARLALELGSCVVVRVTMYADGFSPDAVWLGSLSALAVAYVASRWAIPE